MFIKGLTLVGKGKRLIHGYDEYNYYEGDFEEGYKHGKHSIVQRLIFKEKVSGKLKAMSTSEKSNLGRDMVRRDGQL